MLILHKVLQPRFSKELVGTAKFDLRMRKGTSKTVLLASESSLKGFQHSQLGLAS